MRLEHGERLHPEPAAGALVLAQHQVAPAVRRRLGRAVECGRAQAALVRLVAGVLADMVAQPLGGEEGLRTVGARVVAHLLVRLQMLGQRVVLVELAAAHIAIEAPAAMRVHVIAEHRRCAERGRTVFALVGSANTMERELERISALVWCASQNCEMETCYPIRVHTPQTTNNKAYHTGGAATVCAVNDFFHIFAITQLGGPACT